MNHQGLMNINVNLSSITNLITLYVNSLSSMKLYLGAVWKDLTTRAQSMCTTLEFTTFHKYFALPRFVSQKLFNAMDYDDRKTLDQAKFVTGMCHIYAGNLSQRIQMAFSILDFDKDEIVQIQDIQLLFRQLHMVHNQTSVDLLEEIIQNACDGNQAMTYAQWVEMNETNSDLFFLLFFYVFEYKPFYEQNINYYNSHSQIEQNNDDSQEESGEEDIIAEPSEMLFTYLNLNFHLNLKYESEDQNALAILDDFEHDMKNAIDFFEIDGSIQKAQSKVCEDDTLTLKKQRYSTGQFKLKYLRKKTSKKVLLTCDPPSLANLHNKMDIMGVQPSRNQQSETLGYGTARVRLTLNDPIYKMTAYYSGKKQFQKCTLALVNDELFVFKYSNKTKKKKLSKILSLKFTFVDICEKVSIRSKVFFTIQLDSNYKFQSHPHFFFFENEEDSNIIIQLIRKANRFRKIEDTYTILNEIGRGHFGKVYKGISKLTGENVAIKVLMKSDILREDRYVEMIEWELDIFNFLRNAYHKGITRALDKFETPMEIYLVYEYCKEGNLRDYLLSLNEHAKDEVLSGSLKQIAESLKYLHFYGIVHRDLKPENVLIQKNNKCEVQVKIIDFGLSKVLGFHEKSVESSGTLHYVAPEVLLKKAHNHKVDIWSFGVTAYYLKYSIHPFDSKNSDIKKIMNKIASGVYEIPYGKSQGNFNFHAYIDKIIISCLQMNPKNRPDWDVLINLG